MPLTSKTAVLVHLIVCRDASCLFLRCFVCVAVSLQVHKFLSLSLLVLNVEGKKKKKIKFSAYGVSVLPADGKMTPLLPSGEVSTPLCPTFQQQTPECFLGAGEQTLPRSQVWTSELIEMMH